ncbi:hypothetical protein [Oceanobacillus manasiensis]|uniref:hypothetical protein n=1 Tax=Oceanobacillus manasiensis TaxID=586413 RepID=UPI0005AAECD9|nr:hypothetical protein [Oceanobacillus manasiensis]
MVVYIIAFIIGISFLFLFNRLMGYQKGSITIDFEERYYKQNEHLAAIKSKLENEGREVYYKGNSKFIVDGKNYNFIERTVNMGGAPLQRTILIPEK